MRLKMAYYLENRPSFTLDPTFHAGAFTCRKRLLFLIHILKSLATSGDIPRSSGRLLDGKSTLLSSYLVRMGYSSNESDQSRAQILKEKYC